MKAVWCLVLALAVHGEDVRRIAELKGDPQRKALRAILADDAFLDDEKNRDAVFYFEAQLRPALRSMISDPAIGVAARSFLLSIGAPDDLRLVFSSPPSSKSGPFAGELAYEIACTLLEPGSEEEWVFLRRCALNEYDDPWADAGAIQTLKLIASPRSRGILEEVGQKNKLQAKSVARALEYIQSNPPPLNDRNLEELAKRVAQAARIGKWEGNRMPRYNMAGDKALVDLEFRSGADFLIYTATFHRSGDGWKLRGVRETLQLFGPVPIPPKLMEPPNQ